MLKTLVATNLNLVSGVRVAVQAVQAFNPQLEVPLLLSHPSGGPHRPQHVPRLASTSDQVASTSFDTIPLRTSSLFIHQVIDLIFFKLMQVLIFIFKL